MAVGVVLLKSYMYYPYYLFQLYIIFKLVQWLDNKILNNNISFRLREFIFFGYVLIMTTLSLPMHLFYDRGDCDGCRRMSPVLKFITYIIGIKWIVRGKEIMGDESGCIVVMNHQTSFDVLGMFYIWKCFKRLAAVAKKEIYYFWPFGLAAHNAGVVFIDRQNTSAAKKQLAEISKSMHEEGTKLLLFPEGTRNKNRTIGEFKKGAFYMAVQCQVPIMPIVASPYLFINHKKKFCGSGPVIIEALPLIPTKGLTDKDVPELTERVRNIMKAHYEKLSDEIKTFYPTDYPGLDCK